MYNYRSREVHLVQDFHGYPDHGPHVSSSDVSILGHWQEQEKKAAEEQHYDNYQHAAPVYYNYRL